MSLKEMAETSIRQPPACRDPAFSLLELIAVLGVVEEVREVGKQIQAIVKEEAGRAKRRGTVRALEFGCEALAVRFAPIAGIQEPKPWNQRHS